MPLPKKLNLYNPVQQIPLIIIEEPIQYFQLFFQLSF